MVRKTDRDEQLSLGLPLIEADVLCLLNRAGASRVRRVVFRRNRSTIWSLTQRATVLNLHEGYRKAPPSVIGAFAVIAADARRSTSAYRSACKVVRDWPGLEDALSRLRHGDEGCHPRVFRRSVRCVGTADEKQRFRTLYASFNEGRFKGRLPADLTLRISGRMKTRLGHITPQGSPRRRSVGEIALNRVLFRAGSDTILEETLLHEMAHVAAYLFDGDPGHGLPWRRWATRVGCMPTACVRIPVV